MFLQGAIWSERFERRPFTVVHDDATIVERYAADLVKAGGAEVTDFSVGRVTVSFPVGLNEITFARSHDDPRVQIADVFAGAAAWLYAVRTGLRPADDFARALHEVGIGEAIVHATGPPLKA